VAIFEDFRKTCKSCDVGPGNENKNLTKESRTWKPNIDGIKSQKRRENVVVDRGAANHLLHRSLLKADRQTVKTQNWRVWKK